MENLTSEEKRFPPLLPDYQQEIMGWLEEAKALAHAPVSDFQVGAVALGASGKAYLGANLEFLNQPLSQSVHAEQAAIYLARVHEETALEALIVSAVPCGHCRQFLLELGNPDLPVIVANEDVWLNLTLKDLIPHPFMLTKPGHGLLSIIPKPIKLVDKRTDDLAYQAMEAASQAYVPYTQGYCGVAIGTKDDRIFWGSRLESAAYNPTLLAFQAGLIHLISEGGTFDEIQEIVLVETSGVSVSETSNTWNLLKSIAPLAKMEFMEAVLTEM